MVAPSSSPGAAAAAAERGHPVGAELSLGPATGTVGRAQGVQQARAGLPAPCGMRGQTTLSLGLARAPRGSPGPASSLPIPCRTRCCHCWGYGWLCTVPLLPECWQWLSPPSRSPGDTVFSRHMAVSCHVPSPPSSAGQLPPPQGQPPAVTQVQHKDKGSSQGTIASLGVQASVWAVWLSAKGQ